MKNMKKKPDTEKEKRREKNRPIKSEIKRATKTHK